MAFPTSPTNGQTAVVNGITYTYDNTNNAWTRSPVNAIYLGAYNQANIATNIATSGSAQANAANNLAASAYAKANTGIAAFYGTTGVAFPANAAITITGTNGVTVAGSGNTLTVSTSQNLQTTGSPQFNSIGVGTSASGTTGEIRAVNNITAYYSDDRLKTKIGPITDPIKKVMSLEGFYYHANETAQALGYEVKQEIGVSAQEVQKILPEVVAPAPIDEQYLTVRYEKLVPLLIEAIKELKREIDQLKEDNK